MDVTICCILFMAVVSNMFLLFHSPITCNTWLSGGKVNVLVLIMMATLVIFSWFSVVSCLHASLRMYGACFSSADFSSAVHCSSALFTLQWKVNSDC